jgi:uncharacterized protein involved in type VI secretion and phage assembly
MSVLGFDLEQPVRTQRLDGVYPGIVTDVVDPNHQGRVKVKFPWLPTADGESAAPWARLATFMAGPDRGSWFIPEVDDEVVVAFVFGDPSQPMILGALWNGVDTPPETMDGAGQNNIRSITSRLGHKLTFDDTQGQGQVVMETAGGHHLTFDDGGQTVTLEHSGGAKIEVDASGTITIQAVNQVKIQAPAGMQVDASQVTVNAALSKFSGVVKASTVIANAVISSSYTPGAGNIW